MKWKKINCIDKQVVWKTKWHLIVTSSEWETTNLVFPCLFCSHQMMWRTNTTRWEQSEWGEKKMKKMEWEEMLTITISKQASIKRMKMYEKEKEKKRIVELLSHEEKLSRQSLYSFFLYMESFFFIHPIQHALLPL